MTEKYKCGSCGFVTSVEFSEGVTVREVPCGGCYWEEWEDHIISSHFDSVKGVEVVDEREQVKHVHGALIRCEKGKGI